MEGRDQRGCLHHICSEKPRKVSFKKHLGLVCCILTGLSFLFSLDKSPNAHTDPYLLPCVSSRLPGKLEKRKKVKTKAEILLQGFHSGGSELT